MEYDSPLAPLRTPTTQHTRHSVTAARSNAQPRTKAAATDGTLDTERHSTGASSTGYEPKCHCAAGREDAAAGWMDDPDRIGVSVKNTDGWKRTRRMDQVAWLRHAARDDGNDQSAVSSRDCGTR